MPNRTNWIFPVVIILALLLLGMSVWMWEYDRIFAAMIGATAIAIMISTTIIGRRQARLDRLERQIILSGLVPLPLKLK